MKIDAKKDLHSTGKFMEEAVCERIRREAIAVHDPSPYEATRKIGSPETEINACMVAMDNVTLDH